MNVIPLTTILVFFQIIEVNVVYTVYQQKRSVQWGPKVG